jgi:hypothetical protein
MIGEPQDIVFVARKRLHSADWTEVLDAVDDLLRRSGLSDPNSRSSDKIVV